MQEHTPSDPAHLLEGALREAASIWWPIAAAFGFLLVLIALIALIAAYRIVSYRIEQRRLLRSGMLDIDKFGGKTFEVYLEALFSNLGYRVERTRFAGDYGGDLVLAKGGVRTVVQAKRYTKSVGVKAVQEAVAAKAVYDCTEAMVVTNSHYTRQAEELARKNRVELWDREKLADALHSIGGQTAVRDFEPRRILDMNVAETRTSTPQAPTMERTSDAALVATVESCGACGKVLSFAERGYCEKNSRRFEGRMLCFQHQRTRSR